MQRADPRLHTALKLIEFAAQPDNLLDARQIDAKFLGQAANLAQVIDVALRIEACLTRRAARFDQTFAFVKAERLRVHIDEFGGDADDVERAVVVRTACGVFGLFLRHSPP